MRADFASLQRFHPDRGPRGELHLLGFRGFDPTAAAAWEWVRSDSQTSCAMAMGTGERVAIADIDGCEFMAGTEDLKTFRQSGIRATQSTPLFSRSGTLMGMLSTHWGQPHQLTGTEERALDILARQAADLIERTQIEAAVRQRTAQFETLLDRAPLGVYLVDADLRILQVNTVARPVFGDIPNLIGRDFDEVIHTLWVKAYADEVVRLFQRTLESGEPFETPERAEYRVDRQITEYYRWRIDRILLPDNRYGVVCYFTDISEQVRARHAIAESEAKYRTLFKQIDEGFCIVHVLFDENNDPVDYRFVEVNPAFERQTGLANAEGKRMRELAPDHEQHWFEIYGAVALTGRSVRFQQRAQQLHRWYDVYAFRVGPAEERRVAVLFNDISERKRVEEALREADRRKDEFLAMLGHELRNPLGIISNAAQLLGTVESPDPALRDARETIERQVGHTSRMLEDLLDVSRISRGKFQLDRQAWDLRDILRQTVEDYRSALADNGLHLELNTTEYPVRILADRTRLSQAIGNLLHNAGKFTQPGGMVQVTMKREDQNAVILKVRDNGIGIEADALGSVFEPFHQADRTLDRSRGGLGLGLSLVKWVVQLHGGEVSAASEGPCRGSEITIRLPLDESARDESPDSSSSHPATAGKSTARRSCRILIIEDNPAAAHTARLILERQGHTVALADNGAEAVQAALQFSPEVVFCDVGLPGLDGYAVAQCLRQEVGLEQIYLVGISGYALDERRAGSAGFNAYLTKPVNFAQLGRVLANLDPKTPLAPALRAEALQGSVLRRTDPS